MSLPIHIAFDALSGVDGSARFSFGPTTALASVSGPIAARLAAEHPVRATIDVHVRPLSSVPSTTEKHTASTLKGIIERSCILAQHPRTAIQVVVQALSPAPRTTSTAGADSHSDVLLAAQINASTLALLDAGSIPMRGVVCAVAVSHPTAATAASACSTPRLVVAQTDGAIARSDYAGCFAFLFGVDQTPVQNPAATAGSDVPPSKMIWTNYRGSPGKAFTVAALEEAEKIALEGATAVWMEMKEALRTLSVGRALS